MLTLGSPMDEMNPSLAAIMTRAGVPAGPAVAETGEYANDPYAYGPGDASGFDASPDVPQPPTPRPRSLSGYTTNPAMMPILHGAQAADDMTAPPMGIDPGVITAPREPAQAADAQDGADPFAGIHSLIQKIASRADVSPDDKALAIAKAGFGMAASRSPWLLGAIGEGGLTGLSDYREAQQRASQNAIHAATLGLSEQGAKEAVRTHKATEAYRTEDIRERAADRKDRLAIQRQQSQDLREYRDALLGKGKWQIAGYDDQKRPILFDANSGDQKVLDLPVETPGKGGHASVFKLKLDALKAAGYDPKTATEIASGVKPADAATIERVAIAAAKAKSSTEVNPARAKEVYDETYAATKSALAGHGAASAPGAGAPPAAPAAGGAVPTRPSGVPAGAKWSPSQRSWWWQDGGEWKSSPAE